MLLDGHRIVRAAFDGRVVGDDHAVLALHDADPGDDAGARRVVVVHSEAASAESSRKSEPGSSRRSTRSRAVSLLRRRCFRPLRRRRRLDRDERSRNSATNRSMRAALPRSPLPSRRHSAFVALRARLDRHAPRAIAAAMRKTIRQWRHSRLRSTSAASCARRAPRSGRRCSHMMDGWERVLPRICLRRAGFGGTPDRVAAFAAMTAGDAAASLLTLPAGPNFDYAAARARGRGRAHDQQGSSTTRRATPKARRQDAILALQLWWLNRMLYDAGPSAREDDALLPWALHDRARRRRIRGLPTTRTRSSAATRWEICATYARSLQRRRDADLSRTLRKTLRASQRELRARADGALHARRRQL
jgi:hypothetical protein